MKTLLIICFVLFFSHFVSAQMKEKLYPIKQDNRWGFIDQKGNVKIEPIYFNANQFSEGLAPVRVNGIYGYIDEKGNLVIKPHYDLALPFIDGMAKVFIDSNPYFIDTKGKILFQHNYKRIDQYHTHKFAIAITQTNKYCVINRLGDIIIDSVFLRINEFNEGVAIVEGLKHLPYSDDTLKKVKYEIGIIDTNGNWIVEFGKYENIRKLQNGYYLTTLIKASEGNSPKWRERDNIINKNGLNKFNVQNKDFSLNYYKEKFIDD